MNEAQAVLDGLVPHAVPSVVPGALKILSRMRQNLRNWRIEDLQVLARRFGIEYRQHGTSHVTFRHPKALLLTVPADRPIKPVYVRRFLQMIEAAEGVQ